MRVVFLVLSFLSIGELDDPFFFRSHFFLIFYCLESSCLNFIS